MEFEEEKSFHVLREAGRVPSLAWTRERRGRTGFPRPLQPSF